MREGGEERGERTKLKLVRSQDNHLLVAAPRGLRALRRLDAGDPVRCDRVDLLQLHGADTGKTPSPEIAAKTIARDRCAMMCRCDSPRLCRFLTDSSQILGVFKGLDGCRAVLGGGAGAQVRGADFAQALQGESSFSS